MHLDAVVELLSRHGYVEAKAVAYLHDVLEDTATSYDTLCSEFGETIAQAVRFCSDEAGASRRERKKRTLARMREDLERNEGATFIDLGIKAKVADRLANSLASHRDNPSLLSMYCAEYPDFRSALYIPGLCDDLWE